MPLPFNFTQSLLHIEHGERKDTRIIPESELTLIHYYQRLDELYEAIAFYEAQPADFTSVINLLKYKLDLCGQCIKKLRFKEGKSYRQKQLARI